MPHFCFTTENRFSIVFDFPFVQSCRAFLAFFGHLSSNHLRSVSNTTAEPGAWKFQSAFIGDSVIVCAMCCMCMWVQSKARFECALVFWMGPNT